MRKNIYVLMLALLALAPGCRKSSGIRPAGAAFEIAADVPEGAMLFNVLIDGSGTRSHFADDASTTSGETANLVWDADDDIGVYAIYYDADSDDFDLTDVKCGLASIKTINADGSAVFYCTEEDGDWWMKDGDDDDDSRYLFVAYYPAHGVKHPFELAYSGIDDGEEERIYSPLFTIPANQDGKSWDDDQVMMDLDLSNIYSRKDLVERTETVTFPSFTPLVSLFQFKPISLTGEAVENVDSLTVFLKFVTMSSNGGGSHSYYTNGGEEVVVQIPERYYYENDELDDFIGLSGTGILSLFFFGLDNLSIFPVNGASTDMDEDEWLSPKLTISQKITMAFDEPVSIPAALENAEMYSLVVSPILFWDDEDTSATLLFEAYSGGDVVLVAEKSIPSGGIQAGYRYNFNLAMGTCFDLAGGTDAGSYSEVVTLTQ